MQYFYLTDNSAPIVTLMGTLGATKVFSFPQHTAWIMNGTPPFTEKSTLSAVGLYAYFLLPTVL